MTYLTPDHPAVEAAARAMHAAYERRAERWEAFYTRTPWEAIDLFGVFGFSVV